MLMLGRRLLGQSALYALSNVILRGGGYLLIPVYARLLSTAEYGVLGIVGAVMNVASLGLMFGLYAAAGRLYFDWDEGPERKQLLGTLWLFLTIVPAMLLLALDRFGAAFFAAWLPAVPYEPYVRLALWSAYLGNFALLPTTILRNREQPARVLQLTLVSTMLTVGLALVFVAVFRQGVVGVLIAGLLANLVMAFLYARVVAPTLQFRWRPDLLGRALVYSLPFWPHALAGWMLNLSDRVLLERFVPLAQVGVYTLGYQVAQALSTVIEGGNQAWAPFFFRTQSAGSRSAAALGSVATYFVTLATALCLAAALAARPLLRLVTPPAYWPAAPVAAIIALAFLSLAPYYIWANTIMHGKRVAAFPLITLCAGLTNVALNLWLIPRWGIWAAAANTVVGNVMMAGLSYLQARRQSHSAHEYGRWFKAILLAVLVGAAGQWVRADNVWLEGLLRALLLGLWLAGLLAAGFLSKAEQAQLARLQVRH